jgi:hypothetical protein
MEVKVHAKFKDQVKMPKKLVSGPHQPSVMEEELAKTTL